MKELAALRGGIIGVANLSSCVRYRTADAFARTTDEHRNNPDWFKPGGLYGFVFQNLRPIAYHPYPGQTMFFTVSGVELALG